MEELSDYSSEVLEFKPPAQSGKHQKLVDNCIGTDPLPPNKEAAVDTAHKSQAETQTQVVRTTQQPTDDKKLAKWLRRILPAVEVQLSKGLTPLLDSYNDSSSASSSYFNEENNIQTYQKISMGELDSSQGIAAWLSVHTNNAPILVASTIASHDDWCEHLHQTMKVFVPKRMTTGNFVVFTEVKSVPLKACLQCLCTNTYNKSIFAGSTLDGELHIWQYQHNASASSHEVEELFNITSSDGYAVALDWATENRLFSFHTNGAIISYNVDQQIVIEGSYTLNPPGASASSEITAAICLSANSFVVATKDGGVYYCGYARIGAMKKQIEITPLKKHIFMVSTLLKAKISGYLIVISCDLSGQIYYHDIRNGDADEETASVIAQIPLPFKNAIACSSDGSIIYCPGTDGSLECYRITYGTHTIIKGALRGKGNFIKCSDNGCWIITGLYMNDFQIFYLDQ